MSLKSVPLRRYTYLKWNVYTLKHTHATSHINTTLHESTQSHCWGIVHVLSFVNPQREPCYSSPPYVGYIFLQYLLAQQAVSLSLALSHTHTHTYLRTNIYMPGACNYLCVCEWLVAVSSWWLENISPSRSGWHLSAAIGLSNSAENNGWESH